ncbi:MAG: pilus assembly protein [Thioclava sp.]|nr:TadE/TadG family type IV pilus assembly protein [Thioclava sp.]MBD3802353.1 pilus assembly protein [Thioclava sp.]
MSARLASRARKALRGFARDENGATLVEFALVIGLYLMIFFALIDFGRMAFHYVNAQRALQVAARLAAVRSPACDGVPPIHERGVTPQGEIEPNFGTNCNASDTTCANPGTITCAGNADNGTAKDIWSIVQRALPNDAEIGDLSFSYSYDPDLGFLGGPYVPIVTVKLQNLDFQFVTPIGAFASLWTSEDVTQISRVTFPSLSTSMPGEALGRDGTS